MSKSLTPPKNIKEALRRAQEAAERIKDLVRVTEMSGSRGASSKAGKQVFFKYENQQVTGSFKIRGAANKLLSLSEKEKEHGVIAASAGNHAQGVAFSASEIGLPAKVVMPIHAPLIKLSATKNYGAEVVLHGEVYDEAFAHAQILAKDERRTFIHPFEDDEVIAGQSTVALEIFSQNKDIDTILVPVGGGGLISGVAMVAKAVNPRCRVIGVQAGNMPGMSRLFQGQENLPEKEFLPTIADGIAVKRPSQEMYEKYISQYVDDVVTVSEEEIAEAIVFLIERKKTVAEGAAACGLAAAFSGRLALGEKNCVVVSGGNIDINTISKVIQKGLAQSGRLTNISVVIDDSPGALSRVCETIGSQRANILDVGHSRTFKNLGLRQTRVNFLLETIDEDHIARIEKALESLGGRVIS